MAFGWGYYDFRGTVDPHSNETVPQDYKRSTKPGKSKKRRRR